MQGLTKKYISECLTLKATSQSRWISKNDSRKEKGVYFLDQVLIPRLADVFCAVRVNCCNILSLCMMKNSCLISENRVYECRQYLAVTIAESNCLAWYRTSNQELVLVLLTHTWRDARESQQKLNLTLKDHSSKSSVRYLTSDWFSWRKSYWFTFESACNSTSDLI
jgi:hypothetical protein